MFGWGIRTLFYLPYGLPRRETKSEVAGFNEVG